MNKSHGYRKKFSTIWALIFFKTVLLAGICYGQNLPPIIKTEFELAGEVYLTNMEPKTRKMVSDSIEMHMAILCENPFGFLRWTPGFDTTGTLQSHSALRIKLTGKAGQAIQMKFSAINNGNAIEFSNLPKIQLYDVWDDPKSHEPKTLIRDIKIKLESFIESDAFQIKIHEGFLKAIPIINTIQSDSARQSLIVPIKWEALNAGPESILSVEFFALNENVRFPGIIKMQLVGPWKGMIMCAVNKFIFLPVNSDKWDVKIPEILEENNLIDLTVFMEKYFKNLNPGTMGTTVIDP